jgi:hypothetical protein
MPRSTLLVLVALGAAGVAVALSFAADPRGDEDSTAGASVAAGPQVARLGWHERTPGPAGARIEFGVDTFEVLADGWRARLSVRNDSSAAYEIGDRHSTVDRSFGLMLFSSGKLSDLEERNSDGTLPALRPALRYRPSLPDVLEPHERWSGTISARGALVAGSWVRFVFGALIAVGRTPDELPERLVWITDHAYRLHR